MPSSFKLLPGFHRNYFLLFLLLLFTEIAIAVFAHDTFIRPYAGDFLVVMLLYCFVKSFFSVSIYRAALYVLVISFVVEGLQYFGLVNRLHLQNSRLARTILGSSFEWRDLLAYVLGLLTVIGIENWRKINQRNAQAR